MRIIFKASPIASPIKTERFGNRYDLKPIGRAVSVSVVRHIPNQASILFLQGEVDRKAVIVVRFPAFCVGDDISFFERP